MAEARAADTAGSMVNSQVTDAVAALNCLTGEAGPPTVAAMLDAMSADSIALAMLNAVARQQNDATIGTAALATICARIAGTPLHGAPPQPESPEEAIARAEAQALVATLLLKGRAAQDDEAAEAAKAALARIAAAASRRPRSGRTGGAAA